MNRFMVMAVAAGMLAAGTMAKAEEIEIPKGWHYEACEHAEDGIVLRVEYSLEGISKVHNGVFYFRKSKRPADEFVACFGRGVVVSSWSSAGPVIGDTGPYTFSFYPRMPTDKGIELQMGAIWIEDGQKKKVEKKFLVPYRGALAETRGRLSVKAHFERSKVDAEQK